MTQLFDPRMSFLFTSVLGIISPITIWIILSKRHTPAVHLWCSAGLIAGTATSLLALRGTIPDILSFLIANMLLLISFLLRIQSLRLDLQIPISFKYLAIIFVAFFAAYQYFSLVVQNNLLRFIFAMVCFALLSSQIAWCSWLIYLRQGFRNSLWITGVYILIVLIYLVRIFTATSGYSDANILGKSFDAIAFPIASIISAVFGNIGYLGVALDRSLQSTKLAVAAEARQIENQRLSRHIAHLDRQRSLCLLSTSLGHELNQPLTAILTHTQIIKRRLERGNLNDMNIVFADLDRIAHNTQRASEIIARIRGFIRPVATHQAPVELNQLLREIIDLVAATVRSQQIQIYLPPHSQSLFVSGDAVQLSQVVLNVLQNAIDAVAYSTQRDIFIQLIDRDPDISLRIQDSGIGLTPDVLDQIGQPFFTTKATGLGMGFAIAQNIAEQHGGQLTITNAMPCGAMVELILPRLDIHSH